MESLEIYKARKSKVHLTNVNALASQLKGLALTEILPEELKLKVRQISCELSTFVDDTSTLLKI